jgi:hypothetical protein
MKVSVNDRENISKVKGSERQKHGSDGRPQGPSIGRDIKKNIKSTTWHSETSRRDVERKKERQSNDITKIH